MMNLAFYSALLSFIFLSVIGLKHMYDKYKLRKMVKISESLFYIYSRSKMP